MIGEFGCARAHKEAGLLVPRSVLQHAGVNSKKIHDTISVHVTAGKRLIL